MLAATAFAAARPAMPCRAVPSHPIFLVKSPSSTLVTLGQMVAFYIFSLVLGGGFMALSLLGDLFGGHDVSMSTDATLDADVGFDAHLETDAGHLEVGGGSVDTDMGSGEVGDIHADAELAGHGGDLHASQVASKIFSIRTVIYSLFGFGAVGTLLTYAFHSASAGTTAAFAVVGGVLSGTLVNAAFGWVKHSESGALESEGTYSGQPGRVTLPLVGAAGKVVVSHAGREVELRALPHPSALEQGDPTSWTAIVVVEMKEGVALVAPAPKELLG